MKKLLLFETEIDFTLPSSEIEMPCVGYIKIETRVYDGKTYAKFQRFSPETYIETTIEEWLTGIRLQYIVQDALIRKSLSIKP
jgi:sulfur transfer protein SufE